MHEIPLFSHCLSKLMQKYGLTSNQLSASIGCARADLKQVLSTEGTETRRNTLFSLIKNCNLFLPEDLWTLEKSLEVSRMGLERYRFHTAMEYILSGCFMPPNTDMLSENGQTLTSILSRYQQADEVDILCLNSCFPAVIQALRSLFDRPERKIRMWHLISSEAIKHRSATYVAISLPLLFDRRYHPYGISAPAESGLSPVGGNMLTIRGLIDGVWQESFFSAVSPTSVYELPNAALCSMFHHMGNLFKAIRTTLFPLKEHSNSNEDFTSLCMTFLSHELNRATYSLTNGLCFHQVPVNIAVAAITDSKFFTPEEAAALIERTCVIHEQRYQNLYRKHKPTYMIMTQLGCEQFLDTGVNLDHFVGFRPFTPIERRDIFKTMLKTAEENPYYSPLLMKDPHFQHRYNLECYDNLGVSLDAKDTDYDLFSGYQPVFLMFPEFTRQYLSYYLENLVTEKCFSRDTSLRLLWQMYHNFLIKHNLEE